MRRKLWLFLMLIWVAISIPPTPCYATEIILADDFEDESISTSRWDTIAYGAGGSVTEENDYLNVTTEADTAHRGVVTDDAIDLDRYTEITIQVEVSVSGAVGSDMSNMSMQLDLDQNATWSPVLNATDYYVIRQENTTNNIVVDKSVSGTFSNLGSAANHTATPIIRVLYTRADDTIYFYEVDGTTEYHICNETYALSSTEVYVYLYGYQSGAGVQNGWFDNFIAYWEYTETDVSGGTIIDDVDFLMLYLTNLDFIGFFVACYTTRIGEAFYALVMLAFSIVLYNRTESLPLCCIMWLLVGSLGFLAAAPVISPFAVVLMSLGIIGLIYRTIWGGT